MACCPLRLLTCDVLVDDAVRILKASPNQLGDAVKTNVNLTTAISGNSNGFHTEETCSVYNQLKVVRHMLTWAPTVELVSV